MMEPLADKLARLKTVKRFFAGIQMLDKRLDRLKRFICVTFFATAGVICFTILLIPFWDSDSTFSLIAAITWMVICWPVVVAGYFGGGGTVLLISGMVSGLFWAFMVELFFVLKKRRAAFRSIREASAQ